MAQEFAASGGTSAKPNNAEDYWSPQGRDQGVFDEKLGYVSNVAEHDGTECLKWDDSLWSHADHFRVSHLPLFFTRISMKAKLRQISLTFLVFCCSLYTFLTTLRKESDSTRIQGFPNTQIKSKNSPFMSYISYPGIWQRQNCNLYVFCFVTDSSQGDTKY